MSGRPLLLFNSLGRTVQPLRPNGPVVGIYSCGPLVFSYPHLGTLRAYVTVDVLRRALHWKGYATRHVVMITDVNRVGVPPEAAAPLGSPDPTPGEVAEFYTRAFLDDLRALNVLAADEYPRGSAHIEEMLRFARRLEALGYTYRLDSGLYFDTAKVPDYGRLAGIAAAGQREGARTEQIPGRRNKTDFALWRAGEATGDGRPGWDSPWGPGYPGWHLFCSAVSMAYLGGHFDIHTGVEHHREIHHPNEIAQSEAYLADGLPWVGHWFHNGFLRLESGQMRRSGAANRLRDLIEAGNRPEAYRYLLLGGHYRNQLTYSARAIGAAQTAVRRLAGRTAGLGPLPPVGSYEQTQAGLPTDDKLGWDLLDRLDAAVSADLNTAQVLALLHEVVRADELTDQGRRVLVASILALTGLALTPLIGSGAVDRDRIEELVRRRDQARAARDWARADALRAELAGQGIRVTDTPEGGTWEYADAAAD